MTSSHNDSAMDVCHYGEKAVDDHPTSWQQPQPRSHPVHVQTKLFIAPKDIYFQIVESGHSKYHSPLIQQVVLGVVAGCYLGFGFCTCMLAAGQLSPHLRASEPGLFNMLFGAFGFPLGLSLIIMLGGNLVTGNMAAMTCAYMQQQATLKQCAAVLLVAYFANLAGCLLMGQIVISGELFLHRELFTIELSVKKCSSSFLATFVKGIMCNWLVNCAICLATSAGDVTGKFLGVWFPISAFVTMGFEHCVANMFLIPLAMRLGAPITLQDFLVKNLIPATLGNFVGGAGLMGVVPGLAFGAWGEAATTACASLRNRLCMQPKQQADEHELPARYSITAHGHAHAARGA